MYMEELVAGLQTDLAKKRSSHNLWRMLLQVVALPCLTKSSVNFSIQIFLAKKFMYA